MSTKLQRIAMQRNWGKRCLLGARALVRNIANNPTVGPESSALLKVVVLNLSTVIDKWDTDTKTIIALNRRWQNEHNKQTCEEQK